MIIAALNLRGYASPLIEHHVRTILFFHRDVATLVGVAGIQLNQPAFGGISGPADWHWNEMGHFVHNKCSYAIMLH